MIPCPHCGQQFDTRLFYARHVKYCEKGPHPRRNGAPPDIDESLDCYWCGKLFKDFKALALHVQNHGVIGFDETVRYTQQNLKLSEANDMALPTPEVNANGNQNPFLKRAHFGSRDKGTLKVLGGRVPTGESLKYNDILLDVKLDNKAYTWGLKADQRNYAALFKRFGTDEKKWKGTVQVVIAKDKYINVVGS